jgi:hypothetical protein
MLDEDGSASNMNGLIYCLLHRPRQVRGMSCPLNLPRPVRKSSNIIKADKPPRFQSAARESARNLNQLTPAVVPKQNGVHRNARRAVKGYHESIRVSATAARHPRTPKTPMPITPVPHIPGKTNHPYVSSLSSSSWSSSPPPLRNSPKRLPAA